MELAGVAVALVNFVLPLLNISCQIRDKYICN